MIIHATRYFYAGLPLVRIRLADALPRIPDDISHEEFVFSSFLTTMLISGSFLLRRPASLSLFTFSLYAVEAWLRYFAWFWLRDYRLRVVTLPSIDISFHFVVRYYFFQGRCRRIICFLFTDYFAVTAFMLLLRSTYGCVSVLTIDVSFFSASIISASQPVHFIAPAFPILLFLSLARRIYSLLICSPPLFIYIKVSTGSGFLIYRSRYRCCTDS